MKILNILYSFYFKSCKNKIKLFESTGFSEQGKIFFNY